MWVGASDEASEGDWRWVDSGLPLNFTYWITGQPDNGATIEHCLEIFHGSQQGWNDRMCDTEYLPLCEFVDV